jgi:hypothetical protein
MMPAPVTDIRSNRNDQIVHAATVLKGSVRRMRVFAAIYRGKKKAKTVEELMADTSYSRVVVLQMGGQLAAQQLVTQVKIGKKTAYEKDRFYGAHKRQIMKLAKNPKKLKDVPTKVSLRSSQGTTVIKLVGARIQITPISCDDIVAFAKVHKIKNGSTSGTVSEKAFKEGIKKLIGETGKFQDWGGEKNDLYTTKVRIPGKRRPCAFAFKGPGTRGVLTPRKLGKNGDQIQRLFQSPAEVFIVQYHDQIDESVITQMREFSKVKSAGDGTRIWYGVIDGDDTARLLRAYPRQFGFS